MGEKKKDKYCPLVSDFIMNLRNTHIDKVIVFKMLI